WVSPRAEPPPSAMPILGPEIVLIASRSLPLLRRRSAKAWPRICSGVSGRGDGVWSKTVLPKPSVVRLRKGSETGAGKLAPADVAAAEAFGPVNFVHACVSTLLCLPDTRAQRGHVKHASALSK